MMKQAGDASVLWINFHLFPSPQKLDTMSLYIESSRFTRLSKLTLRLDPKLFDISSFRTLGEVLAANSNLLKVDIEVSVRAAQVTDNNSSVLSSIRALTPGITNAQQIRLCNIGGDKEFWRVLLAEVDKKGKCTILDIGDCYSSYDILTLLPTLQCLKGRLASLHLQLFLRNYDQAFGLQAGPLLARLVEEGCSIKSLNLTGSQLNFWNVPPVIAAAALGRLQHLELVSSDQPFRFNTRLSSPQLLALCETWTKVEPAPSSLNLQGQHYLGLVPWSVLLPVVTRVNKLGISDTRLPPDTMRRLLLAVVDGCNIEELEIADNHLAGVDTNLIIAAVTKLKVVKMGGGSVSKSVVVDLLEALGEGDHGGVLQELLVTYQGAGVGEELVKKAKERAGLVRLEVVAREYVF